MDLSSPQDTATPVRYARTLRPGQRAQLYVLDPVDRSSGLLVESGHQLFEAPTWHPDGQWLVVNADGLLFRVDTTAPSGLQSIPTTGLPELNNDHLISPDGRWHYVSANDWHIYRVPWEGGRAERVTQEKNPGRAFRHFLHGISPDGRTLAYVGTETSGGDEWALRRVWQLDLETGEERLLGDGYSPADGPEFAPDGRSIYFNSEMASTAEGHAQLFRHDLGGGTVQQLTDDDRVNWFPHPSPDGRWVAYLSYPPGTVGHPADLPVELRLLDLSSGHRRELVALFGGQGTINVPSWSPDSRSLAYVAYPLPLSGEESPPGSNA